MTAKITLLDCTLRDGGYPINFQFTARDTRVLCEGLDRAGIRMIEVGHGLGLGASVPANCVAFERDENYIAAAKASVREARIGCFFIPDIGTSVDLSRAAAAGLDFVRIGSDPTGILAARSAVDDAKAHGLDVSINIMKSYAVTPSELAALGAKMLGWGLECISVVDSAGCMLPSEVKGYVAALRDVIDLPIGFHGHNNLGLANANCLVAVEAGATVIDGTLRGMGRGAGNAQTEVLAHLLPASGHGCGADPFVLFHLVENQVTPLMEHPSGLAPVDVVSGMAKFHSSYLPIFQGACDRYRVDLKRLIVAVSKINCINPTEELIASVARNLRGAHE
jgi:4-hydroxy 2-oxovalerate aldolase